MSVILQYFDEDGAFQTVHQPDTKTAIQAAIILARDHNAKPHCILSANAGVLVARKCLEQQVGFALDPTTTHREATKRLAAEKRDRDHRRMQQTLQEQLEQQREAIAHDERQRAFERIPGFGSFS